jgi:hypothetical protein
MDTQTHFLGRYRTIQIGNQFAVQIYGHLWLKVKNLGKLLRILQYVIEKRFLNWRVLPLVKINTCIISDTPCIVSLPKK